MCSEGASEFGWLETALPDAEGPPRAVSDAASAAPSMRVAGSLVADIAFDSILDEPGGPVAVRRVRFVQRVMCVEAAVRPAGAELHLVVQTTPRTPGTVRSVGGGPRVPLLPAEPTTLTVEPGITSLLVEPDAGELPAVQTAWLVL